MALLFASASSESLTLADNTGIAEGGPYTFACWFKPTTSTANQVLINWQNTGAVADFLLLQQRTANTIDVWIRSTTGDDYHITTTNTLADGSWGFCAFRRGTSNPFFNVTLNADFANEGERTTDLTGSTGMNEFRIGERAANTYLDGALQNVAVWNVYLDDDDLTQLYLGGVGVAPVMVRPDALVSDSDLWGIASPVPFDKQQNAAWTINNTPTHEPHHNLILPADPAIVVGSAAAAAGGTSKFLPLLGVG
jgi:hypothetical protein